jgi:protein arginine kinase activator
MKCEKCGKNEATMFYQENINGATREMHLCAECAQKENLSAPFEQAFSAMNSLWNEPFPSLFGGFDNLWGGMLGSAPTATLLGTERKCPTCGMTEHELRQTGRVGCPDCYSTFADLLNPYVQKVHGADRHVGDAPAGSTTKTAPAEGSIESLRVKLNEAIAKEEFEQAAKLRDQIRKMEGEQK